MKYLFILGRNPELSAMEIMSFLEKEKKKITDQVWNKNSLFIETENSLGEKTIDFLGGVISIGGVSEEGERGEVLKKLEKKEIYGGEKNKINYVLWDFSEDDSCVMVSNYLKKRFKSEKLKATEKHASGFVKMQGGDELRNLRSLNIDEEFFIFGNRKKIYFGKIIQKCDYEKIQFRDFGKPVRRSELSISPRLAKIMINLSEIKKNEKLLDPFCGIGVILQEALLQNISVLGIDKDKNAIEGCRKNLSWFGFDKKKYHLISGDSAKISLPEKFSAIVTEPDLGKIFRKTPDPKETRKILNNFENLIINTINNLKENLKSYGKIVFTSPLIKTYDGKRASCNYEKILHQTGFKIKKGFPIKEFRENQIVGREIFVLDR